MNVRKKLDQLEERVKKLGMGKPKIVFLKDVDEGPEEGAKNTPYIKIVDEPILREED